MAHAIDDSCERTLPHGVPCLLGEPVTLEHDTTKKTPPDCHGVAAGLNNSGAEAKRPSLFSSLPTEVVAVVMHFIVGTRPPSLARKQCGVQTTLLMLVSEFGWQFVDAAAKDDVLWRFFGGNDAFRFSLHLAPTSISTQLRILTSRLECVPNLLCRCSISKAFELLRQSSASTATTTALKKLSVVWERQNIQANYEMLASLVRDCSDVEVTAVDLQLLELCAKNCKKPVQPQPVCSDGELGGRGRCLLDSSIVEVRITQPRSRYNSLRFTTSSACHPATPTVPSGVDATSNFTPLLGCRCLHVNQIHGCPVDAVEWLKCLSNVQVLHADSSLVSLDDILQYAPNLRVLSLQQGPTPPRRPCTLSSCTSSSWLPPSFMKLVLQFKHLEAVRLAWDAASTTMVQTLEGNGLRVETF